VSDHVVSAGSVNAFKDRFDKCIHDQECLYDWRAKYDRARKQDVTSIE
jgi:hypothetical protein